MNNLTVGEISQGLIALSAFIGAVSLIINTLKHFKENTLDKTVEETVNKHLQPYTDALSRIDNLSTEISLLIQLNLSLIGELREGKINGKTTSAEQKLNDYLIEQATATKA